MDYPILDVIADVKQALKSQTTVVLQAPPGAGKSTILPLQLLNEPWLKEHKIIMLEPRRLAARSVAHRMASLLQENIGETVGYRIRFDTVIGKKTRIEVVTEGILTRMIQTDTALEGIGLIIFDEFHERSLHADLALALSRQLQQILRDDLRILIMSATLDGRKISETLGNAPVIVSEGRSYPVTTLYNNTDTNAPIAIKVARAIKTALRDQSGDILTFLPGAGEINKVLQLLETEVNDVVITPLYGDLPFKKQEEAILPNASGKRKVVLATSIAETSLTIEGITTVVDSGLSRVPKFDPRSGLTRLATVQVTADAAEQRAGRAGRLGPGVCYRLWGQGSQQFLVPHRQPEILEADLAPLILELASAGITNVSDLQWITSPPHGAIKQASTLLHQLGALNNNFITSRGKEMVRLPTHPRLAHMLIEARQGEYLLSLAIDCASILEERDPLSKESGADITLRVEQLQKFRQNQNAGDRFAFERVEKLVRNWCKIFNVNASRYQPDHFKIGALLALAYPDRIAQQVEKNSERYKLLGGRVVKLPDHDLLIREEFLVVTDLDAGSNEGRIFLAAPLHKEDLYPLAEETEVVQWDDEADRIVATVEKKIGPLTLERKPQQVVPSEKRIEVLCPIIQQKGLKFIGWNEEHQLWQARVMSMRSWRPDESWPDVGNENLLHTVDSWLSPYLIDVHKHADLLRLNLMEILNSILPWELQRKLEVLAPVRMQVPSQSLIKIRYMMDGSPPVMEVRLQEVFGLLETPKVNEGRTPVLMHLLSPGFRPVQITMDLRSFWETTYSEVRKELRVRYPKHHWPEDPWTAQAVRGVKRKQ